MAPPTTKPRLDRLDPGRLARETVEQLVAHLERYALPLQPGVAVRVEARDPGETDLAWSIRDLCAWAQRGEGEPAEIPDLLASVCSALYPQPIDGGADEIADLAQDADPETEIGLVLAAAWARLRLSRGESLSTAQLAALGSVDPQHVRLLVRQGEIAAEEGQVHADEARRWLSARGT